MEFHLLRLVIRALSVSAGAQGTAESGWMEIAKVFISAAAPVVAAIIVGIAGALITNRYAEKRHKLDAQLLSDRNEQDRESAHRTHAIELTKLEMERKYKVWTPEKGKLRPVIFDFLAIYRDIGELYEKNPKELSQIIRDTRVAHDLNPDIPQAPQASSASSLAVETLPTELL